MPDFERLTDSLREHTATNPFDKGWAKGYRAGKRQARVEILCVIFLLALAGSLLRTAS